VLAVIAGFFVHWRRTPPEHAPGARPPEAAASEDPAGPSLTARDPALAPSRSGEALMFAPGLLTRLRRQADGRAPDPDPAIPATNQVLLMNRAVSTLATAPAYTGPFTARGTAPYLIQFSGPVDEAWQDAVREAGATLINYIPNNAWLVEMSPAIRQAVDALPMVRWSGALEPADKMQPFLRRLEAAFRDDYRRLDVSVLCLAPADLPVVSNWLAGRGMAVRAVEDTPVGGIVKAAVEPGLFSALSALAEVQWIEEDVRPQLHNDMAVIGSHMNVTSVWHAYGLTGQGQIVGHADTGLDIGSTNGLHPDFADRLLAAFALGRTNSWSDVDSHGTHTAGSILGTGAMSGGQYRGVAWQALLVHQSLEADDGSLNGIPANLASLFQPTYDLGARVHSDSWGSPVFGAYDLMAAQADAFMWNNPSMLLVFSAGNDGIDANANGVVDGDSIGSPGTAKNLLTVGAMESDRPSSSYGYTWRKWGISAWPSDYPAEPLYTDLISYSDSPSPYQQGMAAFSARGPADDGRIKPEVVASGTDVVSCRSRATTRTGWGVAANNNYIYNGGTSMSCPLTAGAAALIRQYLVDRAREPNPSAALIKALLISGARSMTPGQYGTSTFQEIPAASPNNVEGFGQVDVGQSVYPSPGALRFLDRHGVGNRKSSNTVFTVETKGLPLSVTLAWTDYPASTLGGGAKLYNDYDLTLMTPDGQTLYPNGKTVADHLNPAEVIRIPAATGGVYTATVYGYSIKNSAGRYALVIRGALDQPPD
jgi:subtilisin family serine protease